MIRDGQRAPQLEFALLQGLELCFEPLTIDGGGCAELARRTGGVRSFFSAREFYVFIR